MTITYDANGLCTRCGSTGWLSIRSLDTEPCKCHGWRPIEWAPKDRTKIDVCGPRIEPVTVYWSEDSGHWLRLAGYRLSRSNVTHFRPRPQPPEVGAAGWRDRFTLPEVE